MPLRPRRKPWRRRDSRTRNVCFQVILQAAHYYGIPKSLMPVVFYRSPQLSLLRNASKNPLSLIRIRLTVCEDFRQRTSSPRSNSAAF